MAKLTKIVDQGVAMKINRLDVDTIDQNKLWAHFDSEADSMVIYTTGGPVRAVSVHLGDDTYVKVDPRSNNIVGFHIEKWERNFVPAHSDIQSIWSNIKRSSPQGIDWNQHLQMLALWLIFIFKSEGDLTPAPQTV